VLLVLVRRCGGAVVRRCGGAAVRRCGWYVVVGSPDPARNAKKAAGGAPAAW